MLDFRGYGAVQSGVVLCILQPRGDVAFVRIDGDVYLDNQEEFDAFLEDQVSPVYAKIVLDASKVKVMCSAALGAIVKAHKRAKQARGEVVFVHVNRKVLSLLEITRLTHLLKVMSTDEEAFEYLNQLDTR